MKTMKTIIKFIILLGILSSCTKEEEIVSPSVLVKEVCCSPIYYAEILHKDMYKIGDTMRITYNQMPKHEWTYPHPKHTLYTTVVLINK